MNNQKAEMSSTHQSKFLDWLQYIAVPSFIALLTLVFYHPSLSYPFQFDDLANITKKFDIRFFDPFKQILCNSRWLGEWLNKLNYQIGGFNPWYYRACNVSIHILTGIFVFLFIYAICKKMHSSTILRRHAFWIANMTMTLFLLHPVQTQTVSYVIQARLEGLATLFIMIILNLFLAAYAVKSLIARGLLLTLMTFLGFISCGTKEIVIVTPFLVLAVDWFFLADMEWDQFKKRLWFHALFGTMILCSLLYYLKPQFFFDVLGLKINMPNNRGNILTDNAMDLIKPFHYLISEFKVILHYLWIFVWPFGISVEYDWKLVSSFFSPDAFLPFLLLLSIVSGIIYLIHKKKLPALAFGLLWFLIAIAPRSTLIPSPELVCDYKTYLASIGWLFLLSIGIIIIAEAVASFVSSELKNNFIESSLGQSAFVLSLAFGLGWASMERNIIWSSAIAFWHDVVIKAPLKARAHNNLGVALSEEGKFDESIPYYLQAIKLDRFYSDPWSNLAVAYSVKNEDDKAKAALQEAIRIFPNYPEAYNNLGTLYLKSKEFETAEKMLRTAISLRGYYGKAWFNLGRMYLEQEKTEDAWQCFNNATKGDLDNRDGFHVLGQVSMQIKKYADAVTAFEKAFMLGNPEPSILFNLANAYFMNEKYEQAGLAYAELHKQVPQDPRFVYNLAESKFALKKFDEAIPLFKIVAEAGPDFAHAYLRIAHAYENMKDFEKAKNFLASLDATTKNDTFKKMITDEVQRLALQEQLSTGTGTVTLTGEQFKKLLASRTEQKTA
jgi:tetratricopeptide (TPR) repeat protein